MKQGDSVGIVACSNGQLNTYEPKIKKLIEILNEIGLNTKCSPYLYERDGCYFTGSGQERAEVLNGMYDDGDIKAIFDISGGDVANEVLGFLDYDKIKNSYKCLYGYSDLTTVLNAIYTKTGKESGLYQIRNLIYERGDIQKERFQNTFIYGKNDLTEIDYFFIQEGYMEGVVVGGNIRCFLKLAGTEYMPDLSEKILLLEGLNTTSPQAATYLCQLGQMGAFEKINGILLGTFTRLDAEVFVPSIEELVQRYVGRNIPVARTMDIGHNDDAKCIYIGRHMRFES